MITRAIYNNKSYKILDGYNLKYSNNEVTFNDIKIDFTKGTILDIPYKYQEIKIVEAESEETILSGKVKFTGYLEDIELSDMKVKGEEREMTLTLLSPLKMATKRNVSLIGTYEIEEAIRRILQPLVDDGFKITEINIPDGQITVNFVLETIENCMNNIGFKRNIFWYINELKEISVNSIDYMFGLPVKKKINEKEEGLINVKPRIDNVDYANIINIKNVRLIYTYWSDDSPLRSEYPFVQIEKQVKKGDIVNFDYPVIVDEQRLMDIMKEDNNIDNLSTIEENRYYYSIFIEFSNNDYIAIGASKNNKYKTYGSVSFSDEKIEKDVVLQRDSFFSNLITGFKWNKDETVTISSIRTDTALRYTTMRFMYSEEINKLKEIISESGQVEKTVDFTEKWTTLTQLVNYARSLMLQNTKTINQVELLYDCNPNLNVGDTVDIEMENFFVQGEFAIKDIEETYYNETDKEWKIILKNSNLISTYIDIFRPQENQENQECINTVILSEFIEDKIIETHNTEVKSNEHTLNFNL